mmetsp:Transcript_27062/g.80608  ORF Transcript_27062/g.80608 Transcript_27062/m.80608 type:complete len:211 (-) Transcript_27062:61-693(-)
MLLLLLLPGPVLTRQGVVLPHPQDHGIVAEPPPLLLARVVVARHRFVPPLSAPREHVVDAHRRRPEVLLVDHTPADDRRPLLRVVIVARGREVVVGGESERGKDRATLCSRGRERERATLSLAVWISHAGSHPAQQHAERVHVRRRVGLQQQRDLGGRVLRRAALHLRVARHEAGEAEVQQLRPGAPLGPLDDHVARLDVRVHDGWPPRV